MRILYNNVCKALGTEEALGKCRSAHLAPVKCSLTIKVWPKVHRTFLDSPSSGSLEDTLHAAMETGFSQLLGLPHLHLPAAEPREGLAVGMTLKMWVEVR